MANALPDTAPPRTGTPSPFLTAEWRHIVMANYEIDPHILHPYVPAGTELDAFKGKTWISVVGLLFIDTRVLGFPIPLHRDFEEVNLRFYVRRNVKGETRRGVVFIREFVDRHWVAWIARGVYGENYRAIPMGHQLDSMDGSRSPIRGITYRWGRGSTESRLIANVTGDPERIRLDSEEAFIADHEWGYTRRRNDLTLEYRVEHPPWRIWPTAEVRLEGNLTASYGPEIAAFLKDPPASAFVADGSPVSVYPGTRIPALDPIQPS